MRGRLVLPGVTEPPLRHRGLCEWATHIRRVADDRLGRFGARGLVDCSLGACLVMVRNIRRPLSKPWYVHMQDKSGGGDTHNGCCANHSRRRSVRGKGIGRHRRGIRGTVAIAVIVIVVPRKMKRLTLWRVRVRRGCRGTDRVPGFDGVVVADPLRAAGRIAGRSGPFRRANGHSGRPC